MSYLLRSARVFFLTISLTLISSFGQSQSLKGYIWEVYNDVNFYLKENHIKDITFDHNYGSWIITKSNQLIQWDDRTWKTVDFDAYDREGLESIAFDPKGRLYIANHSKIIYYNPKSNKTKYIKMPEGANATKLGCNNEGVLLIGCGLGSTKGFLYQYSDGEFKLIASEYEDPFHINLQQDKSALVAFRKGLYRFHKNQDGTYSDSAILVSKEPFYKTEYDGKGTLWAAGFSATHLFSFDGDQWTSYPNGPELINVEGESSYLIHDFTILIDGRIAVGTQTSCNIGVYDPIKKHWETYKMPVKHKKDGIQKILWSARGQLWMGTWNNGIGILKSPAPKDPIFVTEGDKVPYTPDTNRTVATKAELKVKQGRVILKFRDSEKYDGDTLSLFLNGQQILANEALEPHYKTVQIKLIKGKNELLLYAHNLGEIPPNTMDIKIIAGTKTKEIILESDLNKCERIILNYF